jgi:cation diffusion facilitator family transporter
MFETIKEWLGFSGQGFHGQAGHGEHDHGPGGKHGHTHGVIDPTLSSSDRGVWAIKWSFVILAVTACLQLVVVLRSGSVALLADTIHNFGDATTAIPLWVAFVLARRRPSARFNYGLGRVEDLAGIVIVLIILASAIVAGYEAIDRFIHPQPLQLLEWVALAGVIGFVGNELVAIFRIRVGREMNSAALIADGYHARTDGLASLAVVVGTAGVWLGFPLADPVVGLLITFTIFGIVWQSAKAVITRSLDGVEPELGQKIQHAAAHVAGIEKVIAVKARWLGHKLHADVIIAVDENLTVAEATTIAADLQNELSEHLPALDTATIQFERAGEAETHMAGHGHLLPKPFRIASPLAKGLLEIVDTPDGERIRLTVARHVEGLRAVVRIMRSGGVMETLPLTARHDDHHVLQSATAPAEPHEFEAALDLADPRGKSETLLFAMKIENTRYKLLFKSA